EELAEYINSLSWNRPAICYDDDEDYTITITPDLATEEPVNSLMCVICLFVTILPLLKLSKNTLRLSSIPTMIILRVMTILNENIDYVDAEIVSSEVVEIVIPEVGGIDDDILLTIKDDILHEKLLNVNLLIANIEALKDNPTPYSDVMTKS
ncbi:hypothetical protein Tco_0739573, partial [Tanacetum coccineum]